MYNTVFKYCMLFLHFKKALWFNSEIKINIVFDFDGNHTILSLIRYALFSNRLIIELLVSLLLLLLLLALDKKLNNNQGLWHSPESIKQNKTHKKIERN